LGDSAYRSAGTEALLKAQGFRSRIPVRETRGHPLSKARAAANRAKSRIRARIEHAFGTQENGAWRPPRTHHRNRPGAP
jgi:IS5 family transposase